MTTTCNKLEERDERCNRLELVLKSNRYIQGKLNETGDKQNGLNYSLSFVMDEPTGVANNGYQRSHSVIRGHAFYAIDKAELQSFADGKATVGSRHRSYNRTEREAWVRVIEGIDWEKEHLPNLRVGDIPLPVCYPRDAAAQAVIEQDTVSDNRVLVYVGPVRVTQSFGKRWQADVEDCPQAGWYRYRNSIKQNTPVPQDTSVIREVRGEVSHHRCELLRGFLQDALSQESQMAKLEKSVVEQFGEYGDVAREIYSVLRRVGHDWECATTHSVFSRDFTEEQMENTRLEDGNYGLANKLSDLQSHARNIRMAAESLEKVAGRHLRELDTQIARDKAVEEYIKSQTESEVE